MPSLQEEVHATLRDVEKQTIDLFTAISASSSFTQTAPTSQVKPVRAQVRQLQDTHRQLSRLVDRAAEHQVNQARLIPLLAQIKERDTKQRDAILRISTLRTELKEMVEAGNKLWTQTTKAEKDPLSATMVLEYAQRLARYTSAPPGYHLAELQAGATHNAQSAQQADYNPEATRAAAYYDPAIPSMPQEMPFPSDRLMRQGILYADAASGGSMPADAAPRAAADGPAQDENNMAQEPVASLTALDSFAMDDDDAFDLDLNP